MTLRLPQLALPVLALALLLGLPKLAQAQTALPPAPPPAQAPKPAAPPPAAPPPAVSRPAQPADSVVGRIDAARKSYQAGKLLEALDALDEAIGTINNQLIQRYAATLPPAPQGWAVAPPDPQRAALMGGASTGARDYRMVNGQGQMNAHIVLDNDAIRQMSPLFGPQMPQGMSPNVRRTRVGTEDAVVFFDPQQRAGEVSVLVGGRILVQVEGQGVASADPMLAAMASWNFAELKRLAGM